MAGLRTEFAFTLPKGFVDAEGGLHRHGTMRLATARDEIEPLRDRNVVGADDPYLTILVLARVITELGPLTEVTPTDVENFFAADLAFLQDLYGIINFGDPADVDALQASVLPAGDTGVDSSFDELPDDGHEAGGDDDVRESDDVVPADEVEVVEQNDDTDRAADTATTDPEPAPTPSRRRDRIEEVRRTTAP